MIITINNITSQYIISFRTKIIETKKIMEVSQNNYNLDAKSQIKRRNAIVSSVLPAYR